MSDLEPVVEGVIVPTADGPDREHLLTLAWLASFESAHTRRGYARDIAAWLTWCHQHDVDPFEARRAHVDTWARMGASFTVEEPKPRSVARRLASVSSWYAYAISEEITDRNPVAHVRRPHVDRDESPTRGLDHDEAKAMLKTARNRLSLRDQIGVYLMLLEGARRSAVCGVDVDDLGYGEGHRTIRFRKKGGGVLTTPLPPQVSRLIDEYLDGRTTGPLLVTARGKRVDSAHVYRAVRRCAALAGIHEPETISPHSLRHAFITLALDEGTPLHVVQDAAGHADPRTTRIYDRARGRLDKHPAYKLGSLLEG